MADLTVTAADVLGLGGFVQGTAGAALTAGQAVYVDSAGALSLADASAAASAEAAGVALCDAAAGQPVVYQSSGLIDPGAALSIGEVYVVSATAGGIAPVADLLSGEFVSILGVATAADRITLDLNLSGVAKA